MRFAETLTVHERKTAEKHAVRSTWFGCFSEKLFANTALTVIYLTMMGAGDSFTMFISSIASISGIFFMIPCAGLTAKLGLRMTYTFTCITGCCAFLGMALAPFCGVYGKYILILTFFIYAMTQQLYSSAWYPLLDNFLLPSERSKFFSRMRFSYNLLNAVLIFGLGQIMGNNPAMWFVQCIYVCGGLTLLGRKFEMDCLPVDPNAKRETVNISLGLKFCFRNSTLVGFSLYTCLMNFSYGTAMILGVLYMRTQLKYGAETLMTYSALSMAGLIIGFGIAGKIIRIFKVRRCQICTHIMALTSCALLLICVPENPANKVILVILFLLNGITSAFMSCINSTEMMALSRPGSKVMTTAFFSTASLIGGAVGKLGTTFVLGCGALTNEWTLFSLSMSKFQFLFIFFTGMSAFLLLFLPLVPSIIPKHKDYYCP